MNTAERTVSQQLKRGVWMLLGYCYCKRSPHLGHTDPVVEQLWGLMKRYGEDSNPIDLQPKRFIRGQKTIVPATEVPRYRIGELFRAGEGGRIVGSVKGTPYRFDSIDLSSAQTLRGFQCRELIQDNFYSGFKEFRQTFFTVVKGCTDKKGNRATLIFPSSVIFCAFYVSSHKLVAALFRDRFASDNYNEFWDPTKSHWVQAEDDTYFVRLERGMMDYDFWLIAHFAANNSYWHGARSLAQSLHGNMAAGAPPLTLFPCQSLTGLRIKGVQVGSHESELVLLVLDIQDYDLSHAFPKPIRQVKYERDNPGGSGSKNKSTEIPQAFPKQKLKGVDQNFTPSVDAVADSNRIPSEVIDLDYACPFVLTNQNYGVKLEPKTEPDNKRAVYVSHAENEKGSSLDTGGQAGGGHPLRIVSDPITAKVESSNLELLRAAVGLLNARGFSCYWMPDGMESGGYNLEQKLDSHYDLNLKEIRGWLRANKRVLRTTRNAYVCELSLDGVTSYLVEIEQRTASESFCAFLCTDINLSQSDQIIDLVLKRITAACGIASRITQNADGPSIHPLKHTNHLANRIEQIIRPPKKMQ